MIETTTLNPKTGNFRVGDLVATIDRFRRGVFSNNLHKICASVRSGKEDVDVEWRLNGESSEILGLSEDFAMQRVVRYEASCERWK